MFTNKFSGTKPISLEFGSEHGLWMPRQDLRFFMDKTQKLFVEKMASGPPAPGVIKKLDEVTGQALLISEDKP